MWKKKAQGHGVRMTHCFGVGAVLSGLLVSGCITYSEQYFIEVEECRPGWSRPHASFLRLDLEGATMFTTSTFEMGWYDRRGVDSLFSTLGPGGPTASTPTVSDPSPMTPGEDRGMDCKAGPNDGLWRRARVYGPNGKVIGDLAGKRLVIIAKSNPGELVKQISTTANSLSMSEQFAGLLRRGEMDQVAQTNLKLDLAGRRHEALAIEALNLLRWLETPPAAGVTNNVLKERLKALSGHASATIEPK